MKKNNLGYYAMDKNENLFQFQWSEVGTFSILINNNYKTANVNHYEILEICYLTEEKENEK